MPRPLLPALATAVLIAGLVVAPGLGADAAPGAKQFQNCTALHRTYPAGVARKGVTHNTVGSSKRALKGAVKFSTPLYLANARSDRDKDGIACELS